MSQVQADVRDDASLFFHINAMDCGQHDAFRAGEKKKSSQCLTALFSFRIAKA